jgi:glycosyltransferase involved in cell wall biosynthesis
LDSVQVQNAVPPKNILIVIPVYNHPDTVRDVVSRCRKYLTDILVVDDGSDEDVAALLADLDVKVIRHERNRGKGQAILTAARYARENNKTHVLTIDADGQHYPEQIPDFIESANNHPDSIIMGVRDFSASGAPFGSRFGRAFGNFWVRIQTGIKVKDIQSGFRVYPVFVLNNLKYLFLTYAFEDEVIVRSLWAGVPVRELAVNVYYPAREKRISHFRKIRDNLKLTVLNTYLTLRSITPWPHLQIQYENGIFFTISHPLKILKELYGNRNHPMKLAMAGSLGIFLGALPLIGCHTLAIIFAASHLRLNKLLAITTSHICMPPVVPALCIEAGYYIRFGRFITLENVSSLSDASFLELGYMALQRLAEWFIGALVIGPVLAVICGVIIFILSLNIQKTILWTQNRKT